MVGKRACSARITRESTVPSPTPASKIRSAGGVGCRLPSSREIRCATSVFSLQVETNSRYFCRLSKNRKPAGATSAAAAPFSGFPAGGGDSVLGADGDEGAGGDPCAVAQARHQLAIVDDATPKRGFGRARRAAVIPDLAENLIGGGGGLSPTFLDPHGELPAVLIPDAIK